MARFWLVGVDPILAALCPTGGEGERAGGVGFVARVGRAFVEEHRDVGSERGLNLHAQLGGKHHFRSIEVVLKSHAFFGDLAKLGQGPNLESSRVGEEGFLPGRETVESAHLTNQLMAGAQPEVVGVAEDDLRAELLELERVESFHRPLGADRHEDRCFDHAVRQAQGSASGGAGGVGRKKGKWRAQVRIK